MPWLTNADAEWCGCRLKGEGADVEAWAESLIHDKGVLVLPAQTFDHAPSLQGNHFRLGLGRLGFQAGLRLLSEALRSTT